MIYDLQKASMWKRISAFLCDFILFGILAVGIAFSFEENVNIYKNIAIIGLVTFAISFGGVVIGNKFGSRFKKKAEIAGGIILVALGVKILLEGVGMI